jgi:hypothetical protein
MRIATVLAAGVLLLCSVNAAAAPQPPATATAVQQKLARAEELFAAGEYEQASVIVTASIAEHEAGSARYPSEVITRLYVLDALIAYAFRDEGYEDRIAQSLEKGLAISLDLDLGDPAGIPPFVQERFASLKAKELARYARTVRRTTVGLFGALVLEPTVLANPSLLQPGISYTFNLDEYFALSVEARFPLQLPLWNSLRGQVGLLYYPSFRVDRICTGVSFYYLFGLDSLTTFTHSLSFGGRIDYLTRGGLGFGGDVEIVRADLVVGSSSLPEPPAYTPVPFLGLLRVVFANITIHVYYAF